MDGFELTVWTIGWVSAGAMIGAAIHMRHVHRKRPTNYQAGFDAGYWEGYNRAEKLMRETILEAIGKPKKDCEGIHGIHPRRVGKDEVKE